MWSISEMKERGKAAFKNNYWRCVLVAFILAALTSGSSMTGSSNQIKNNAESLPLDNEQVAQIMAFIAAAALIFAIVWCLLRIFVLNELEVGCYSFLKKNISEPVTLECLKEGFADYKRTLTTMFLRDAYLALWFCLLFVPGLIKTYSYMMVPYIIIDEPDLSPKEAITRSREMMNGHKWRAFLLDLSFIGWALLSIVTCGLVGLFYAEPYRRSARAALYLELSK